LCNTQQGYSPPRGEEISGRVEGRAPPSPEPRRDTGGAKEMCHSTKRTHRFAGENGHLCDWIATGCAVDERCFSVGSFWKTNPPEGGVWGRFHRKVVSFYGRRSNFFVGRDGDLRSVGVRGRETGAQQEEESTTANADGWASRPYRGEMREMESGVLFEGSSFRILAMKVAG
jgi:hypothetical protein